MAAEGGRTPPVTIGIPTYNRVAMLPRALDSALGQTFEDLDIVVSDDGSSDGTREYLARCRDPRLRVVLQERNTGIFANTNACLRAAHGRRFLLLMDDDFLEPTAVADLLEPVKEDPDLAFSYGQYWNHLGESRRLLESQGPPREDGFHFAEAWFRQRRACISNAILFPTATLLSMGGFPSIFAFDHYATIKTALTGNVAYVDKPISHYVDHPHTTSHTLDITVHNRDRELILDLFLKKGAERGEDPAALASLARSVRRGMGFHAAADVASGVAKGGGRLPALARAWSLRAELAKNPRAALGSVLLCLTAPRPLINRIRRSSRRHRDLPDDDQAMGLA